MSDNRINAAFKTAGLAITAAFDFADLVTTALEKTAATLATLLAGTFAAGITVTGAATITGDLIRKDGTTPTHSWTSATTAAVGAVATAIYAATVDFGMLAIVSGDGGGGVLFADLIFCTGEGVTVLRSGAPSGGPAARTYSMAGSVLKLAMASGSYNVSCNLLRNVPKFS